LGVALLAPQWSKVTPGGSEDGRMSEHQEEAPAKRGEAAWAAAREEVAKRNAQARKAGKQRREAYELEQANARRAADKRRAAELARRRASG
jgi:hypothetical protein